MDHTTLTVRFTTEEMSALERVAYRNLRRPRDQVRLIVRQALGFTGGCEDRAADHPEGAVIDVITGKEVVHIERS